MASRRERRAEKKKEKQKDVKKQRTSYKTRQRNKKILNYSLLGIVIIAVAYGIYAFSSDESGQHDALARCLTQEGVIMYGTDWCPHCQNQKQMFGQSFRYVNYINCDLNSAACDLAGVTGYPTWQFPDGQASGVQSISVLAERSGCQNAT